MAKSTSILEQAFLTRWEQAVRDLVPRPPDPVFQCYFHPDRDWVFDFGWVSSLVVVDLQGGGWLTGSRRGGHSRELGMANDCAKHNAALVLGWRPFLATTSMIDNNPQAVIDPILTLLKQPVLSVDAEKHMWVARLRNLTAVGMEISNNGIRVERRKGAKFVVTFARSEHEIKARRMADARAEVLELILTSRKNEPPKVVVPEMSSETISVGPAVIAKPPVITVVGLTEATQKAAPEKIPVAVPPLRPEDDIANYFRNLSAPPRMAAPGGNAP